MRFIVLFFSKDIVSRQADVTPHDGLPEIFSEMCYVTCNEIAGLCANCSHDDRSVFIRQIYRVHHCSELLLFGLLIIERIKLNAISQAT